MDGTNWQSAKKVGRPKNIKTPQHLWELACDYFTHVDNTPVLKFEQKKGNTQFPHGQKLTTKQILAISNQTVQLPYQRPYTWDGFENYLFLKGVLAKLDDYKANKEGRYSDFTDIIARIDSVIFNNKYTGAAVGLFDPRIVSRDLGLVDKRETTVHTEQPLFPDRHETK
jgi:hypothetical protein